MVDFLVDVLAEIADFFFSFWVDNVIDKFAKIREKSRKGTAGNKR